MQEPRIARFYLDDGLRHSAQAGQHNFLNRLAGRLQAAGYRIDFLPNTAAERLRSAQRRGYAMFHMDAPLHDRALTVRRVYHYPFWAIERSAKRWEWHVAQNAFPVDQVARKPAERFHAFWRNRLFGDVASRRDGFVYVPLQGRLDEQRSFQTCSPLQMLERVLEHDTARPVLAALHPNENYTQAEIAALEDLRRRFSRLTVTTGEMEKWLAGCDYVVTQNSAAAFSGFFFGKPAVLFAQSDFHHIAANVAQLGAEQAISSAPAMAPDYAGYLHWFWQRMSINAGRPDADAQIDAALIRGGWPI